MNHARLGGCWKHNQTHRFEQRCRERHCKTVEASGAKGRARSRQMDKQKTMIDKQKDGQMTIPVGWTSSGNHTKWKPEDREELSFGPLTPSCLSWVAK